MRPHDSSYPEEENDGSLSSRTSEFLLGPQRGESGRSRLFEDYGPRLEAFLHGRLPAAARGVLDTRDLAHDVWIKALTGIERLENPNLGTFWSYLRRVARNHLTDAYRRAGVRGGDEALPDESSASPAAADLTPSADFMDVEAREAFDSALQIVQERERRAVLIRLELEQSWNVVAEDCGYPSPDAARVAVNRALKRICDEMAEHAPRQ